MLRICSLFSLVAVLIISGQLRAQAIATAGAAGTSAHANLSGNGGTTAVFGIEGPSLSGSNDCTDADRLGDHSDFNGNGEHITHVLETELPGNPTVFLFHSHIDDDSDRCKNLDDIDRIRTEIKGGPEGNTDPELEHGYGTTSYYRWQFRLDEGFVGTSRFTHLFQQKPVGGPDVTIPMVTLTARANDLEVIHVGDGTAGGDYRNGETSLLAEPAINNFRGRWVEVFMKTIHRNSDDGGELTIRINDVLTGDLITNIFEENIDMWRGTNGGSEYINRPKWGIYRGLVEGVGQRDETVRYANFCSSENGDICPSLLPPTDDLLPPTSLRPFNGAEHVPTTMQLTWGEVEGATAYEVFFGTDPTPPSLGMTTANTFSPPLSFDQVYYFQVKATDGDQTTMSAIQSFSTLAQADINDWDVVRGHARPEVEYEDAFELNISTTPPIDLDEASAIATEPGNAQYSYFSAPSGNFRWRYRFGANDQPPTVVLRLSKLAGRNNMTWVEMRAFGLNQKISIKADNMKFERTLTGSSIEVDYPTTVFDDNEFHLVRITFEPVVGSPVPQLETKVYLDEGTTPFYTIVSDRTDTNSFLDIGKSGGTNYGANIDFMAINPKGTYPPRTAGAELPADLFQYVLLPLSWSEPLSVLQTGKLNQLNWTVANQVNSDYFTVESSIDGISFSALSRLTAAGNLTTERTYTYTDQRELSTKTYYRVRQTDYDGTFTFSNVVVAEPSSSHQPSIALTPNPTTGLLKLDNLPEASHDFHVISLTGQEVCQGTLAPGATRINLHSLPVGIYLLRLQTEYGELLPAQRFVKR